MNRTVPQLGRQLLGLWQQLGLNQKISVLFAASVVVVALGSLAFWTNRVEYALLYGKLDDAEAAKVISVLDDAKVPYRIAQSGGAIYVPQEKVHLMRMQLASRGIPRGDGVGFEIFDKPNFGISDFVQRANYLRALQGELARTIGQLDQVEGARVMIVLPENRLLLDNQRKPTASVFVRVRGNVQLPQESVNSIRFLVARAVEGLQPGQVTVVDNRGNVLSESIESDSSLGLTAGQLAVRRNLEHYLAKKAEGMLETVLGPGQAVVRVAADVNLDSLTRTEEKFDPESQVVRIATITDDTTDTSNTSAGGGVAGVSSNSNSETNAALAAPLSSSRTKKKQTSNQYEINKIVSNTTQLPGGLKRVSASVFVAARSEGVGPNRKLLPRTPEEMEKLRRIVQNALGIPSVGDGGAQDVITLEEMPFNDNLVEITKDLGTQEKKQFWWNQIQNLIYPLLAAGVLFVFWRMLKRTPVEEIPIGVPLGELEGSASPRGADLSMPGLDPERPRHTPPGVMTAEVFNQLVRENPANMTQAIQSWLSHGKPNQN